MIVSKGWYQYIVTCIGHTMVLGMLSALELQTLDPCIRIFCTTCRCFQLHSNHLCPTHICTYCCRRHRMCRLSTKHGRTWSCPILRLAHHIHRTHLSSQCSCRHSRGILSASGTVLAGEPGPSRRSCMPCCLCSLKTWSRWWLMWSYL